MTVHDYILLSGSFAFIALLGVSAWVDYRTRKLKNCYSLGLLGIVIATHLSLSIYDMEYLPTIGLRYAQGVGFLFITYFLIWALSALWSRSWSPKTVYFGMGDLKVMTLIFLMFGFGLFSAAVFVASCLSLGSSIAVWAVSKPRESIWTLALPFGPSLFAGVLLANVLVYIQVI